MAKRSSNSLSWDHNSLYDNLEILEFARRDLKEAVIDARADDHALYKCVRNYQGFLQKLELVAKIFKGPLGRNTTGMANVFVDRVRQTSSNGQKKLCYELQIVTTVVETSGNFSATGPCSDTDPEDVHARDGIEHGLARVETLGSWRRLRDISTEREKFIKTVEWLIDFYDNGVVWHISQYLDIHHYNKKHFMK